MGLVLSDALEPAVRFAVRRDTGASPEAGPALAEAIRGSAGARDLLRFALSPERAAVGM